MAGQDWSRAEVDATVADYFDMLKEELAGRHYIKKAHRQALQPRLNGRSEGAIEFKHRNISAVLCELETPYIIGYKPAYNYQSILVEAVTAALARHAASLQASAIGFLSRQSAGTLVEVGAPSSSAPSVGAPWPRAPMPFDFLEEERKRIGDQGEALVYEWERERVGDALGSGLVRSVEWVARTRGDGLGYDIRSIDVAATQASGRPVPLLVEVKTTTQGEAFPFFLSENERRVAQANSAAYRLCRVFDLNRRPRFFTLSAAALAGCRMQPTSYRVRLA